MLRDHSDQKVSVFRTTMRRTGSFLGLSSISGSLGCREQSSMVRAGFMSRRFSSTKRQIDSIGPSFTFRLMNSSRASTLVLLRNLAWIFWSRYSMQTRTNLRGSLGSEAFMGEMCILLCNESMEHHQERVYTFEPSRNALTFLSRGPSPCRNCTRLSYSPTQSKLGFVLFAYLQRRGAGEGLVYFQPEFLTQPCMNSAVVAYIFLRLSCCLLLIWMMFFPLLWRRFFGSLCGVDLTPGQGRVLQCQRSCFLVMASRKSGK